MLAGGQRGPNIHGFNDLPRDNNRAGGPIPGRGAMGGRPIGGGGARDFEAQMPMMEPAESHTRPISMMRPPLDPNSPPIPDMCPRILPRIGWKRATTVIIIIDLLMFLITLIVGGAKCDGAFVKGNEMAGPSAATLALMGGKCEPAIRDGDFWLLFTPMVLHSGILHLASNSFFQLRFGYTLEVRWTVPLFLVIYILTGFGASLLSAVQSPNSISVGASGALFGLLGANLSYLIYNWPVIPDNKFEACFLSFVIIINFILGFGSNIDNWAHFGGFVTGFLGAVSLMPVVYQRPNHLMYRVASAVLGCGFLFLMMMLLWVGDPKGTISCDPSKFGC